MKRVNEIHRRQFLFIFGTAGVACAFGIPIAAEEKKSHCIVTPELTEGPFFVDEKMKRSNVIDEQPGLPLNLQISVYDASSLACAPLSNVQVDIWHANASGIYSDVGDDDSAGKKFLRGYQITDRNGMAAFQTIYPGWYPGRTPHIHLKARLFSERGSQTLDATTQLFFDDAISDAVYAIHAPYNTRGGRRMKNADDGIYGGRTALMTKLEGSAKSGYTGLISIGIAKS